MNLFLSHVARSGSHLSHSVGFRCRTLLVVSAVISLLALPAQLIATESPARPPASDADPSGQPESNDEPSPTSIAAVRVGIGGYYKNGCWTPVRVHFSQPVPQDVSLMLEITAPDSDGTPVLVRQKVNSETAFRPQHPYQTVYTLSGRKKGPISVTLKSTSSEEEPAEDVLDRLTLEPKPESAKQNEADELDTPSSLFSDPVPMQRPLYLVIGEEKFGLQEAIAQDPRPESLRPQLAHLDSLRAFPDTWWGLDAVDTVVLTTQNPAAYADLTADDARIEALLRWIEMGGRLLFLPGKHAEPLLSDENAPLAPFLPGSFQRMTSLKQGRALEQYVGSLDAVEMRGSEEAPFLEMPFLADISGKIEASEADLALIVRQPRAFGVLLYCGGDYAGRPMSLWKDRGKLLMKLLGFQDRETELEGTPTRLIHLGYHDLAGQLRSALDQFDGVRNIPFSLVILLIVVYLLFIGPLDWLVVHRWLKKPVLTWVTFPGSVVLFCVAAILLAGASRSDRAKMNRVDLVDIDATSGHARGASWANLYSPENARYSLSYYQPNPIFSEDAPTATGCRLSWFGLSGSALGGMEPKTLTPTLWDEPYRMQNPPSPPVTLEAVPLEVAGTKSFTARWWNKLPVETLPESHLVEREGIPHGEIHYPLPFSIEQSLLIYGEYAIPLGRVEPGQTVTVDFQRIRHNLNLLVTGSSDVFKQEQHLERKGGTYNQKVTEPSYILRAMLFYRAAGGPRFTGLHHTYQEFIDLSDLLPAGRAVLVGTIVPPKEASESSTEYVPDLDCRKEFSAEKSPRALPGKRDRLLRVVLPVTRPTADDEEE